MGKCPKCNSPIAENTTTCNKCGAILSEITKPSGTLDVEQHFQLPSGVQSAEDVQGSIESSIPSVSDTVVPENTDARGTLNAAAFMDSELPSSSGDRSGTEIIEEPEGPAAEDTDARKTMEMADAPVSAPRQSYQPGSTAVYSEDEFRNALGDRGSSGSEGELRRLWEAAIGSSGKDSRQSLRHERAEASDSVFRRIATRNVAEANVQDAAVIERADYQIKDRLGAGAMGLVFSALQTAVNRVVALKTIKAEKAANAHTRRQFFYEAEITADLDHPNIPPIYELGTTPENSLFYSMKLIQGVEWQKVMSSKTREENLAIFGKVADAIAFAHSRNIIHRDIKPDNVMIGMYGEVYVTDWGMAIDLTKQRDKAFGGTPDYMAPEMATNRYHQIDKPSDIYLLGAVLFQVLTGIPPHTGASVQERLRSAMTNTIATASVDDPLLDVAYRAMATAPDARYRSVDEMQEAIRDVLQHGESIKLAERSDDLATSAIVTKDYDKFNRALYGFQEAIALWKDNKVALGGLKKTRLAFGQCAFDKGDFDLALQTLDRAIPVEAQLFDKAVKAKKEVEQRENRFKRLRKTFVGALIAFLAVTSGLAGYAWLQKGIAEKKTKEAENAKAAETVALNDALDKKKQAEEAKAAETVALMDALQKKKEAEEAKAAETIALMDALAKKKEADEAKAAETIALMDALEKKREAENARAAESLARIDAQRRAAQVQIGEELSKLSLANLQLGQYNIRGASRLLSDIRSGKTEGFDGKAPRLDSWASRRIELLANADLPTEQFGSGLSVTAIEFASSAKIGFVGTKDGKVAWLQVENGLINRSKKAFSIDGGEIIALAISPNGDEAIFAAKTKDGNVVYAWPSAAEQPTRVNFVENRSFQGFAYSPDGQSIVAGINNGIWLWKRVPEWYSQGKLVESNLLPNVSGMIVNNVRGKLSQAQWIDNDSIVLTATVNDKPAMYLVNLSPNSSSEVLNVQLKAPLDRDLTVASYLAQGSQFVMGASDGKMFTAALNMASKTDRTIELSSVAELPQKHRSAIRQLVRGTNGRLISMSDEPVAHAWTLRDLGEIEYETYLTGVPGEGLVTANLRLASFADESKVVGVDGNDAMFAWDIDRQKQRRQLVRRNETGVEEYPSPVVAVYSREGIDQAIAISEDGVVDLWNVQSGKTLKIDDANRWSYFGHTPGAELVDAAVDLDAQVIVTSARLQKAEQRYIPAGHTQEFCVWDRKSGNMLSRWSEASSETVEPRITLLNRGTELLIAGENGTRIVDLKGNRVFENAEIGVYFAVANPKNPNQLAMVRRNGAVFIWDRNQSFPTSLAAFDSRSRGLALQGVWSDDGSQFFVVNTEGAIFDFRPSVSDRVPTLERERLASEIAGDEKGDFRASSHHAIDFEYDATLRCLHYVLRKPAAQSQTKYLKISANRELTKVSDLEQKSGQWWLSTDATGQSVLSARVHPKFVSNDKTANRLAARFRAGEFTYVATDTGRVLELSKDSESYTSFGRRALVSSTSDRAGKFLLALQSDGSIWRFDVDEAMKSKWTKIGLDGQGMNRLQLSPDGIKLAMFDMQSHRAKVVELATGKVLDSLENVTSLVWDHDPKSESTLALLYGDGRLVVRGPQGETELNSVKLDGESVVSLSFYSEKWRDEQTPSKRYVLVQTESTLQDNATLHFVPIDRTPNEAGVVPATFRVERLVKKGVKLAVSPDDSLFVTGDDAGAVTVWFASPTWETAGQLFDLEGHLGGAIESISFTADGGTLMTSDRKNRLFGWLSSDRLTPTK